MRWVSAMPFVPSIVLRSTFGTDGPPGTVQLIDAVEGVLAGVTVMTGAPGRGVGDGVALAEGVVPGVGETRGVGVGVAPMAIGPAVTVPVLTSGAKVSSGGASTERCASTVVTGEMIRPVDALSNSGPPPPQAAEAKMNTAREATRTVLMQRGRRPLAPPVQICARQAGPWVRT